MRLSPIEIGDSWMPTLCVHQVLKRLGGAGHVVDVHPQVIKIYDAATVGPGNYRLSQLSPLRARRFTSSSETNPSLTLSNLPQARTGTKRDLPQRLYTLIDELDFNST